MARTAILFPGQGCLTADSGERARERWPELVDRAGELLAADPFERASASTEFAQPAIFVAGMAAWHVDDRPLDDVCAMAGHSLGEFTALAAAGALALDQALELVILRGRLMARAAEAQGGGMVALLGGDESDVEALASRHDVAVANDNAPGQLIVSGRGDRLQALVAEARERGLKTMELDVTGAFHSAEMSSAVLPLRRALERTPMLEPRVPVVSGLTAQPFADVPLELSQAVISPVRWREVMQTLVALGATDFVDMGPGKVLARLVKRNVRGSDAVAV
jgi:malonyl CoA-acyl carrier protein transacylase